MLRKILNITILLSVVSIYLFTPLSIETPVHALSCPDYMSDQDCLTYLKEQASSLEKEKDNLTEGIDYENWRQGTLSQQISSLNSIIAESENSISSLEVDIETKTVEIRILGKDIAETQSKIDIMSQEIDILQGSVDKRVTIAYKYSFINPIELFLESENFESLLRRMKYLGETRKKDKEILEEMGTKLTLLNDEETVLSEKKVELEEKRVEIETEKTKLFAQKEKLDEQKAEQANLLAISRNKETELLAELDANRAENLDLDKTISQLIAKLWAEGKIQTQGYVSKGAPIGQMGSTGCSSGAHVHFSINNGTLIPGWGYFWGNLNPWNGYLKKGPDYWQSVPGWTYYNIRSGTMQVPIAGSVVLTQNHHQGMSIDLYSLNGPGATVLAADAGQLATGTESVCGGKYALIEHSNGSVTIYLHIQ